MDKGNINRRLILIANDGGEKNKLPGVAIDMKNYHDFFTRPEGGAWDEDEEIHTMVDFSSASLLHNYIMMMESSKHVDYWLIVFCGHGFVNSYNDTVLCMSDGSEVSASEINTWVTYSPCTLIADCCRKKEDVEVSELIEESLFSDTVMELNKDACKLAYNRFLGTLPSGSFFAAYATNIGECAGDSDMLGGVYSYNLLKSADQVKQQLVVNYLRNGESAVSLAQVHDSAYPKVVKMRKGRQHPCRSNNTNIIPFVVIA
jgi:hypothetical protein